MEGNWYDSTFAVHHCSRKIKSHFFSPYIFAELYNWPKTDLVFFVVFLNLFKCV